MPSIGPREKKIFFLLFLDEIVQLCALVYLFIDWSSSQLLFNWIEHRRVQMCVLLLLLLRSSNRPVLNVPYCRSTTRLERNTTEGILWFNLSFSWSVLAFNASQNVNVFIRNTNIYIYNFAVMYRVSILCVWNAHVVTEVPCFMAASQLSHRVIWARCPYCRLKVETLDGIFGNTNKMSNHGARDLHW